MNYCLSDSLYNGQENKNEQQSEKHWNLWKTAQAIHAGFQAKSCARKSPMEYDHRSSPQEVWGIDLDDSPMAARISNQEMRQQE